MHTHVGEDDENDAHSVVDPVWNGCVVGVDPRVIVSARVLCHGSRGRVEYLADVHLAKLQITHTH